MGVDQARTQVSCQVSCRDDRGGRNTMSIVFGSTIAFMRCLSMIEAYPQEGHAGSVEAT